MKKNSQNNTREPIAIVGIGCRFPGGAHSPEEFWRVLAEGVDGIIDVPADRWDLRRFYDEDTDRPGKMHARQAGFLQVKVDEFDPLFFGISPREAASLDPQQRLLLELTWEAFEDAGLVEEKIRGSETGVFVGGFCLDNKLIQLGKLNRELMGPQTATSSTMVMLSNRISYSFDLRGPSLTMDTACSSSLVAAHYACQSIWSSESDMAIAGGVNTMLTPEYPIAMSKGQFLSKHSRCKTFDEDAGGYVRGEGAGVIVLKPLSKALEDKDYIYAMVRSSGANQDGQTNGITVPNPDAQAALIKRVYGQAGVKPSEVGYVEAHGTGTKAGDPVEVSALQKALSEGRNPDDKCFVGSVKTNIGHLEAGAGVAGLIKASLALNKKQIPPNLHFKKANPAINFEELCLKVPVKLENWPNGKPKAYASINSFGYGGTNGHVLLEGPPAQEPKKQNGNGKADKKHLHLFPFSAKSEDALKDLAAKYVDFLDNKEKDVNIDDLLYSLAHRRTAHRNRLGIAASSIQELKDKLNSFFKGELLSGMVSGVIDEEQETKLVFVYTGMGPQWWAMGRELLESEPVFRNSIEECDKIFKPLAGWSLIKELSRPEEESRIAETQIAQPTNFAIQAALTALWESWGIKPDAVVGHSVGEVAAAYASGTLSLEDSLLVSYHRSRIQQKTAGQGTMLAIGLGEEEAAELLKNEKEISIAAINSYSAVTLAGTETALNKVAKDLEAKNVFNKMLKVEVAYHSYQMDPLEAELKECLASVKARKSEIPLYSTVTGGFVEGSEFGTDYWWQNVRQPVRFAKAISAIIDDGYVNFMEVGPHPVTKSSINECLTKAGVSGNAVHSLKRLEPEMPTLMESLAQLFTIGFKLNWNYLAPEANYIKLPTYPWQKASYTNETARSVEERLGNPGHVFLNDNMRQSQPAWEVEINKHFLPWIEDHQVENKVVIPGAAYVEAGLAIHEKEFGETQCTIQHLKFSQVLVYDHAKVMKLHTTIDEKTGTYSVLSREAGDNAGWTLHASGRLLEETIKKNGGTVDIKKLKEQVNNEVSANDLYENLTNRGLHYGPYFQGLKSIWVAEDQVLAEIQGHEALKENSDQYILHPTILDSAFQSMVAIIDDESGNANPFVPVSIEKLVLFDSPGDACWCHGVITDHGSNFIKGDLKFFNDQGEVLVELKNLTCKAIVNAATEAEKVMEDWFYELAWSEAALEEYPADKIKILTVSDGSDIDNKIIETLEKANVDLIKAENGNEYRKVNNTEFTFNIQEKESWDQLLTEVLKQNFTHLLYLPGIQSYGDLENVEVENVLDATMPPVYAANVLSEKAKDKNFKLILVSHGAQLVSADNKVEDLSAAPYWGLGQLITNEFPWIDYKLIDIESENDIEALVKEVVDANEDTEIALHNGKRLIKQLQAASLKQDEEGGSTVKVSTDEPVKLKIGTLGKIDSLHYTKTFLQPPKADEIQIKVHSASINFKDLLKVLGQISSEVLEGTYFGNTWGMECSATVTAVGKDIKDHKVGDEIVVATLEGCFGSYVNVRPDYYVPKSGKLTYDEAPVMIPYMTTIQGLVNLAHLQPGEKVLIHNAAGAVGQAAIQVAKWRKAEIFATAGTEEKREFLKSQGITHVMNSRDLEFVDQILETTKGYGIDVVINAIAGEGLYQSFNLLAPYGRFIEIGKRDIADNTGLPMSVFNRNITFAHIDIDRILKEKPALSRQLLKQIYEGFEAGHFEAFPVKSFPANEAVEAFEYVRQSQHIGKVVINYDDCEVEIDQAESGDTINKEGTYLITGGTGGFGFEIAKWLAGKGVANLVLLSRSGLKSDDVKAAVENMEQNGTKVYAPSVDITNGEQVAEVIQKIKDSMAPLKGIFHGAMVLDDAFLKDLDRGRFEYVMNPKIKGAINLHQHTKDIPLDFFLSFSSISSLIGNPGQGNYVAANAFLDAFAHYRRSKGLAATTVNLGVLAEVGVVARSKGVGDLLEGAGITGFSSKMALESLDEIIRQDFTQVGLFDVNWRKWAQGNPRGAASTLFKSLVESQGDTEAISEKLLEFANEVASYGQEDREPYIEQLIAKEIANVLRLPVEKIELNRGINFLGIDSLMAVELERGIHAKTGVEISTMELLSGPTVQQLVSLIFNKLPVPQGDLSDELDNLSEEELDALLEAVS